MEQKNNELEKFRAQIDIIDQAILELIGKRHSISNSIGEVKKGLKLKILNQAREKELLDNIKSKARRLNLNEKHIEEVWLNIIKESRKVQKKVRAKNGE